MNNCSKTNNLNSIISVSSSPKLDLNDWLRLGDAIVRGASGVDYILGSGVLRLASETSFCLM